MTSSLPWQSERDRENWPVPAGIRGLMTPAPLVLIENSPSAFGLRPPTVDAVASGTVSGTRATVIPVFVQDWLPAPVSG